MTVKAVRFVVEVDNAPDDYDNEGRSWTNQRIYELTNDDGSAQFISVGIEVGSYGTPQGVEHVKLTKKTTKTVEVWA